MQFGQRVAFTDIVEAQYGHSVVEGPGAPCVALLIRFACVTSTNTANATIMKLMMSVANWP